MTTPSNDRGPDRAQLDRAVAELSPETRLERLAAAYAVDPSDAVCERYLSTIDELVATRLASDDRPGLRGVDVDEVRQSVARSYWMGDFHNLPAPRDGVPVAAHVRTVWNRRVIDEQRRGTRRRRRVAQSLDDDRSPAGATPSPAPAPDALAASQEGLPRVWEAIESLPAKQREVVLLTIDGLTPTRIAERLGEKPSGVRMNLSRARTRLREVLDLAPIAGG